MSFCIRQICRTVVASAWVCALSAAHAATPGTFERPFAANSLWNSTPVNPVLGTATVPTSLYTPAMAEGAWSSGVFRATATDPSLTVVGPVGSAGVWDPDSETYRATIVMPRWPANVVPAVGADGHADIVDEVTGLVHSFYQLRNDSGTWRASQYAWTRLAGRGWGDPAHYFQGARATAVPTTAGLVRKQEIDDGDTQFRHALALSLTYNALAATPAYAFPATAADFDAATTNSGAIPEGTLLMLPLTFNPDRLATPVLRKAARTLQTYGGYVVDRNTGTPFVIYVENGSGFNLNANGWNSAAAADLEAIRAALRPMVSATSWKGADGSWFLPSKNLNLFSMRGTWGRNSGNGNAVYDTWQQAVCIPASTQASVFVNYSNRNISPPAWAKPAAGTALRLTARNTGGATLRLQLHEQGTGKLLWRSPDLADGATADFTWPAGNVVTAVYVTTLANQGATASGVLARL